MSCNGYTNFQTFTLANAIYNTQSLYNFFKDATKEVQEKYEEETRVSALTNIMKNTVNSMKPRTNNNIWEPLIHNAMESINYPEIARLMLEETKTGGSI